MEYRHHPLHGRRVIELLAHCTSEKPAWVRVVLDDGSRRELEVWMLDPVVCGCMATLSEARLSLAGLRSLRELVDAQRALLDMSPRAARRSSAAGGRDGELEAVALADGVGETDGGVGGADRAHRVTGASVERARGVYRHSRAAGEVRPARGAKAGGRS